MVLDTCKNAVENAMTLMGSKGNISVFQAPKGTVPGLEAMLIKAGGHLMIVTSETSFEVTLLEKGISKSGSNISPYTTFACRAHDGGKGVSLFILCLVLMHKFQSTLETL